MDVVGSPGVRLVALHAWIIVGGIALHCSAVSAVHPKRTRTVERRGRGLSLRVCRVSSVGFSTPTPDSWVMQPLSWRNRLMCFYILAFYFICGTADDGTSVLGFLAAERSHAISGKT